MTENLFEHSRPPVPATGCLRRPFRGRLLLFVLAATTSFAFPARSQVPCDFKGVSVGDKLTREELMQRLGIKNFKLDPPRPDFMEMHPEIEKYGINGAAEREDDKIGPYCTESSCNIPFGIGVGDDHIPVKVFVALKADVVYAIEVYFNTIFWNDIWGIITKKYGPAWNIERRDIAVIDYETKKVDQLELVSATHKLGGINTQTKDTCSLAASNIDIIFRHHDSLGTLHAIFAIKREAKDF
ncbi:MAG TPA: hypothetical protein VGM27_18045 [Acidobacteriaceae bacterium]|jgi:hypothetical protein